MDNLTHTLIGAVVAETAARVIPAVRSVLPESTRRNLYMALMVVGGNLPDIDFVYTGITGGTLGYLLHHRGHTHSVIGVITIALLLFFATLGWLRWRRVPSTSTDRYWLAFIALLAPVLHLAMDATNEYGVHPFWPFNNAWFYGDAIFIIEPLFWAAAAPLMFLLRGHIARAVMGFVLLIAVTLGFGSGLVPLPMAVSLTVLIAVLLTVAWRMSARTAAVASLVTCVGIVGIFVLAGKFASRQVGTMVSAQFPDAVLMDKVLAPLPVNPFCWEVITVQLEGDRYSLREAMFALAPGWLSANRCAGFALPADTTVALTPINLPDSTALQWHDEVTMSLVELRTLVQNNCEAAALTRFARALWIMRRGDGWVIGDLRYDREPELSFAELALPAPPQRCPRNIPPWTPPRSDVLENLFSAP